MAFSIIGHLNDPVYPSTVQEVLILPAGFSLQGAIGQFSVLAKQHKMFPREVVEELKSIAKACSDSNPYYTCRRPHDFKNLYDMHLAKLDGAPSYDAMMDWFGRKGNLRLVSCQGIPCLLDTNQGRIRPLFPGGKEGLVEAVVKYGQALYQFDGVQNPQAIIPVFAKCFALSKEIQKVLSRVFNQDSTSTTQNQGQLAAAVAGDTMSQVTGTFGTGGVQAQKAEIGQLVGSKSIGHFESNSSHHHLHKHYHGFSPIPRRHVRTYSEMSDIDDASIDTSTASIDTMAVPLRPHKVARCSVPGNIQLEDIPEGRIPDAVSMEPAIPADLANTTVLTLSKPFKIDYADHDGWKDVDKYETFTLFAGVRDGKKALGISCTGLCKPMGREYAVFNIEREDFTLGKHLSKAKGEHFIHIEAFCRTYTRDLRYHKFLVWGDEEGLDKVMKLYHGLKNRPVAKETNTEVADNKATDKKRMPEKDPDAPPTKKPSLTKEEGAETKSDDDDNINKDQDVKSTTTTDEAADTK